MFRLRKLRHRVALLPLLYYFFYLRARHAIGRARGGEHCLDKLLRRRVKRRQSGCAKRRRTDSVYHEGQINLRETKIHQIGCLKLRRKYGFERLRIKRSYAKCDGCTNVTKDSIAYLLLH